AQGPRRAARGDARARPLELRRELMAEAPIRFGLIGGGWRAEFFTRIAAAMPGRFEIAGVHLRSAEKAATFGQRWRLPVCDTLEAMADLVPDFVVLSVSATAHLAFARELHRLNLVVLCETPAAADVVS